MDPDEKDLHRLTTNHSSFDYYFVDPTNNYCNLLMHFIMREIPLLCHVNGFRETPAIVATKLGCLRDYLILPENVNQHDHFSNTALFYAIQLQDPTTINLLAFHRANSTLKNYQGILAYGLDMQMNQPPNF
ncbi:hypothetical protein LY90DRAFT_513881 [Neocallimastix californiae]|uniref:Ankyrin n=1 Tax=Neocallimastix californiae TaxID=1754190 RepID=A0A1Y2AU18_9FUNG|nr:hypothetical protein LY90DRAFT_513881 [Neocallimastix californiae]|eukprot:ORY26088.1 hypothetical protein LY90DRAFT_513881 [Neocallimastix californiae]